MRIKKNGFTLIELLIALFIMSILGAVIIPNLGKRTPRYERSEFVARFNALMNLAWRMALQTGRMQRITVHFKKKLIFIESGTGEFDKSGKPVVQPIRGQFIRSSMPLSERFQIKQFIIEGFDEIGRFGTGREIVDTFFYLMPDGLSQQVTINLVDTKDIRNDKPMPIGLVINPFTAQFKEYDSFQK